MIPQSLYEREKQVRLEAEALLEAKKQEISEMNHRLMAEAESGTRSACRHRSRPAARIRGSERTVDPVRGAEGADGQVRRG